MSINIGPPKVDELRPRITVIGVGGAGGNAIANMISADIEGVDFIVANTDAQALNNSIAEHRIQLGPDITQGLGAGSRPEVGRAAAEETLDLVERALEGAHMCFIAAGMGGGTGTGAAPVIAQIARAKGILTVGVVTKPFLFEGTRRMRSAEAGIDELQKNVDTLIVIPNQNLFLVAKAETTFKEAFQLADEVLQQGVRSITDLMVMPGLINLDFADVRSVMNEMGKAMMGTGEGAGPNRALEAAERAIANPLLDGVSMRGAKGVIISIIGGDDMKLLEVDEAANHIRELVDPEANIIWGSAFNPDLDGKIRVSVVATGIEQTGEMAHSAATQPLSFGMGRGPKRPVLPLPTEAELAQDAAATSHEDSAYGGAGYGAEPERAPEPAFHLEEPEGYAPAAQAGEQADGLAETDEDGAESDETYASLTGTRIERDPEALAARGDDDDEWGPAEPYGAGADDALELTAADESDAEAAREPGQDELSLDSARFADADEALRSPLLARRRGILGSGSNEPGSDDAPADVAPAPAATGSTLFERMANLSRTTVGKPSEEDEEEEEEGATALRIPRFLGRQNNQ
ncbi:MAG: cell division protein FtsZ [Croceibacterium sp.]